MKNLLSVLGLVLLLAGCAGTPYVNPLPAAQRDALYVADIEINTAQLKADVGADEVEKRERIIELLDEKLTSTFENSPAGSKPATLLVNLSQVESSRLFGVVDVVNQNSQEAIVSYEVNIVVQRSGFAKLVQSGDGKFADLVERFANDLRFQFLN